MREAEQLYMVLVALVIGLGGGLFAVAFRKLIGLGNQVAWHDAEYTLDWIRSLPVWCSAWLPPFGPRGPTSFRRSRTKPASREANADSI